jgi:death-on-curing family protein
VSGWVWLSRDALLAAHDEQLAEHGGAAGVRDLNLFESALARPQNLAAYEQPDAARLAASYAFGIAKDRPFIDGNKRTAFVALDAFLALNGFSLETSDADCMIAILRLAEGELDEAALADWVRKHAQPL